MARRPKSSLLDQVAAEESAAPSLFSMAEMLLEKVGKPEFTGASTGERLEEQNPQLYRVVKYLVAQGNGIREINRITGVHHKTIKAVADRERASIDTLRLIMAGECFTTVQLGQELLQEAFMHGTIHGEKVKMKVGEIAMATGVSADKGLLMSGAATSRIEHTETPGQAMEDYYRMISGKVIEAEVIPATGFQGEEVAQKSADPAALVQAEVVEVADSGVEDGLVLAFPAAGDIPTGNSENPSAPDEQLGGLTGSVSVEAAPATQSATHSGGFEAVEDGQPATQEPGQHVESVETANVAATTTGDRKRARRSRTEGGRGSSKSRRVSGGH